MKRVRREDAARKKAERKPANEQAARDAARTPDQPVARRPEVEEPRDGFVGETSDVPEGDVEQGRGRDYVDEERARAIEGQRPRHLPREEVGPVSEHSVREAGGGVRVTDMAQPLGEQPGREPITMAPEDLGTGLLEDATQVGSSRAPIGPAAEGAERMRVEPAEEDQPPLIITEAGEPTEPVVIIEEGEKVAEEEEAARGAGDPLTSP